MSKIKSSCVSKKSRLRIFSQISEWHRKKKVS